MSSDGRGYKVPDPINPGAFKCVKVFIPDDPLYHREFWTAYEYFAKWVAWERDDSQSGKEAAAVWRAAYNMSRAYWPDQEGDCDMPFLLRDDPNDPCKVQQSIDGGTTWTLAFTKECEDTGDTPDDEAIAEAMANNIIYNLFVRPIEINLEDPVNQFVPWCNWWDLVFGAEESCPFDPEEVWGELTPEQIEELKDPCYYMDKRDQLKECLIENVETYVECTADFFNEWVDDHISDYWSEIVEWAATWTQEMIDRVANFTSPNGGGGAAFGTLCEPPVPDECENLRSETGGFALNTPYGSWVAGTGWKGGYNAGQASIELDVTTTDIPAGVVGNMSVRATYTANGKQIWVYVNGVQVYYSTGGPAGGRYFEFPVGEAIDTLRIVLAQGTLNSTMYLSEVCFLP